jgi:hypothetical protein
MTRRSKLRAVLLLSFSSLALVMGGTGCTTVTYRPAPGGAYYVVEERVTMDEYWGLVKLPKFGGRSSKAQRHDDDTFWRGDGVAGSPKIVIVLGEQRAYFYKGGQKVGSSPVCTGSPQFPTPKGSFRVIEKDADHYSSVYGDWVDQHGNVLQTQIDNRKDPRPAGGRFDGAKMFYFMRVTGGVGMHEGYLPGYADSHGCIRLPSEMARTYYHNAPVGTPVKIVE